MGINVNGLGTNPYAYLASAINKSSSQTNKTEAYSAIFEGKIAQTEKVELTEEEKLELNELGLYDTNEIKPETDTDGQGGGN